MNITNISNAIDSHMHLWEMKSKGMDINSFYKAWKENGGAFLLDVGVDETTFEERYNFAFPRGIHISTGIHPNYASGDHIKRVKIIDEQLTMDGVVAIGETGLDYFRDFTKKDDQKRFFKSQLDLSLKHNKPVIIHNRNSSDDLYSILKGYNGNLQGVIHCFSEDKEYLKKFLDLGFYISYAGNITYKNSKKIQESLKYIPLDRLLIETDSPYLSPQKIRGKLNSSLYIGYTIDFISDMILIDRENLTQQLNRNFIKLFKIKDSHE